MASTTFLAISSILALTLDIQAVPLLVGQRIFGGKNASEGQFPFMVNLEKSYTHFCGGSIINENWILTAAHCLYHKKPQEVTVVVGQTLLKKEGYTHKVAKFVFHQMLDPMTWLPDIALIKLATPIVFNDKVQPIQLETQNNIPVGTIATAMGWGATEDPFRTDNLLYVDVETVSKDECEKEHLRPVYDTNICTSTADRRGTCFGDSGGPLFANEKLIGIVSWGQPCAVGLPDVFTKVSSFALWVNTMVQEH